MVGCGAVADLQDEVNELPLSARSGLSGYLTVALFGFSLFLQLRYYGFVEVV